MKEDNEMSEQDEQYNAWVSEYKARLRKSVENLTLLRDFCHASKSSTDETRLSGKIEGVKLALSYLGEMETTE